MKIKQKKIISPVKLSSNSLLINSQVSNKFQLSSKVIRPYLPTKQILCHQLISELGIRTQEQRMKFKNYFADKYRKHLALLQGHNVMQQRFLQSKQSLQQDQQKRINQLRQQMTTKQILVSGRKQKNQQKIRKKANIQQERWNQIIQRNKNQYLKNIKNSMKLIKRWENKLVTSNEKKNQRLNFVVAHVQMHNQYVNNVNFRSRLQQRQESEQNIAKLENSLRMRAKTQKNPQRKKRLNGNNEQNPQQYKQRQSKNLSKIIKNKVRDYTQKSYTAGSEQMIQNGNTQSLKKRRSQHTRNKSLHNSQISLASSNTQQLLRQKSSKQFIKKQQLNQQQVSYLLAKNVQKQKKIVQARNVKNYLHEQKMKQITKRQQQIRYKMLQNLNKLKEQQNIRNNNLDYKFNQNRKKNKYISAIIPKKHSQQEKQRQSKSNISLPTIKLPGQKQMHILPSIKQSYLKVSRVQKNRGQNNYSKLKLNTLDRAESGRQIYLTDHLGAQSGSRQHKNSKIQHNIKKSRQKFSSQQQNQKYNKHIIDKLRSVSLIAHLKYKQNNESRSKINFSYEQSYSPSAKIK